MIRFLGKLTGTAIVLGIFYLASAYVNLTWDPMQFGTWTRIVDAAAAIVIIFRVITMKVDQHKTS
jgi:hypothetical protein